MANVTLNVTDATGKAAGTVEVPAEIFGIPRDEVRAHVPLIHQVVIAQLAAARSGTSAVKNRARISGGGKKPYKQKGTGRARQGSIRAPQFTGGAVVHGPVPRDYEQKTPKKMKAAALRYALSDRTNAGRTHVIDFAIDEPSTKKAKGALTPVVADRKTAVVLDREDTTTYLSVRNLSTVHVLYADQLNTYDVINAEDVVFTKAALDAFVNKKEA